MINKNVFILFYLSIIILLLGIIFFISYGFHKKMKKVLITLNQHNSDSMHLKNILQLQEAMLEISSYMTKINSLNELLDMILKKAIEIIPGAQYGSILVLNEVGLLEFKAIYGFDQELFKLKLKPTECYQWRATSGHFTGPIIIQNIYQLSKDFMTENHYTSMNEMNALDTKSSISAPLLVDGEFFGSINIDSSKTNAFHDDDIKLMAYFADQVTIAIRNHQYYEKILYMSKYDGLTGTINRHYFQEYAKNIIENNKSNKTPVIFVIMDLNNFKIINDKYGHTSGDSVLIFFARAFTAHLAETDFFARYGGDEFIAVFNNCSSEDAAQKMQMIHEDITKRSIVLPYENQEIKCHFSYGMAEYPREETELKNLIHLADLRMYAHKYDYKNIQPEE